MNLARMLLEYEVIASDQVPLLLKMGDDQRAMRCAVESGDTDLVYFTIFHLYKKQTLLDKPMDFHASILAEKQATDLFIKYCKAKVTMTPALSKKTDSINLLQYPDTGKEMYRMKQSADGEAGMVFDQALVNSLKIPIDSSGEDRLAVENLMEQVVNQLREAAALYTRVMFSS